MSVRASRAQRRSAGKRELRREARRDVLKILQLAEEGRSTGAIASTVGLTVGFVELVLKHADEFRAEEGGGGVR